MQRQKGSGRYPIAHCPVLPLMYEYLADNGWIRHLSCPYLGAKARLQSQGISPAALVASESTVGLMSRMDNGTKNGKI